MKKIISICLLAVWQLCANCQPVCNVTKYDEDAGMAQWRVTQMVQDKNGLIWFATWNGIDRFDGYEFVNFKPRAGDGSDMLSDRIRDLRMDQNGHIYCKTEKDWFLFDTKTSRFIKADGRITSKFNTSSEGRATTGAIDLDVFYIDCNGTQWIIRKDGTLLYVAGGTMQQYPLETPIPPVRFYMPDKQGNLWLTSQQGVIKLSFSRLPITAFPQEKPAAIGSLFLDKAQRYWITTKGNDATVRLYDKDNRLLGYLTPQGRLMPSYASFTAPIYCIMQASDGTFWLGSKPGGLYRLCEDRQTGSFHVQQIEGLANQDVYSIKEDAQGRIWVATMGGGIFCICDKESIMPSKIIGFIGQKGYPKMEENMVRYLHITADNVLMAATTEGLLVAQIPSEKDVTQMKFILHKKEPTRASSLGCNATMDILEDHKHRFFIGEA